MWECRSTGTDELIVDYRPCEFESTTTECLVTMLIEVFESSKIVDEEEHRMTKKRIIIVIVIVALVLVVGLVSQSESGQSLLGQAGLGGGLSDEDGTGNGMSGRGAGSEPSSSSDMEASHTGGMRTKGGLHIDKKKEIAARLAGSRTGDKSTPGFNVAYNTAENEKKDEDSLGEATKEETQVLVMYDVMAEAIEANDGDCKAMGEAVEAVVDKHSSSVNNLIAARAEMDKNQRGASSKRLANAEGERMESVRKSLRKGMSKCSSNEQLIGALRKLAKMSEVDK